MDQDFVMMPVCDKCHDFHNKPNPCIYDDNIPPSVTEATPTICNLTLHQPQNFPCNRIQPRQATEICIEECYDFILKFYMKSHRRFVTGDIDRIDPFSAPPKFQQEGYLELYQAGLPFLEPAIWTNVSYTMNKANGVQHGTKETVNGWKLKPGKESMIGIDYLGRLASASLSKGTDTHLLPWIRPPSVPTLNFELDGIEVVEPNNGRVS